MKSIARIARETYKTVEFACGHTAKANLEFLDTYGKKQCPACVQARHEKRRQKQKDVLGNDHRAVELPYWQFKLVEEFGIDQLPGSYNRYKQTTKVAFPRGAKGNTISALLNYLLAKKITSQMQHAKNKAVLTEAVRYYRTAHLLHEYSPDEIRVFVAELKQPFIFNPQTIARISRDLGVDITKQTAAETAKQKREERREKAQREEEERDREFRRKIAERESEEVKRAKKKMLTQISYMNALVDVLGKYTDSEKKQTERKKRKPRKNQSGYKQVVQTRKAYCVPAVKQSYWTKSQKKTTTTGKKKK